MKRIYENIKYYFLGFIVALILINFTWCKKKPTEPTNESNENGIIGVETQALKDFTTKTKNKFLSGKKDSVLAITYEEFAKIYKEDIPNDQQKFIKFGEALEKKKLIFANQFYAEYEVEIDGKKYVIAFGQSGDNNWKIIRF